MFCTSSHRYKCFHELCSSPPTQQIYWVELKSACEYRDGSGAIVLWVLMRGSKDPKKTVFLTYKKYVLRLSNDSEFTRVNFHLKLHQTDSYRNSLTVWYSVNRINTCIPQQTILSVLGNTKSCSPCALNITLLPAKYQGEIEVFTQQ